MGNVLRYYDGLREAMKRLSSHPDTVFVGQSVAYGGQAASGTFKDVPREKLLEFPVAEDFQLGFCCGLALGGKIPICFYPRMDFLILAMNQLVNHLDNAQYLWGRNLHVIIRVGVGGKRPLNAGPQHTKDHTRALRLMLHNTSIHILRAANSIQRHYELALLRPRPHILVEYMERYYK
jgi:pyruvate dehydrogenase E1 component beta subunit